jgi:hypothetical protein
MRLTMKERRSVTAIVATRYQKVSKKEKNTILHEFTQLTQYNRCYAAFLLRSHGKKLRINQKILLVGDLKKRTKRNRQRTYDDKVLLALKKIWFIMDCICGKRLAPILNELVPVLERFGEIELEDEIRQKLLKISPATIDRILSEDKKRQALKTRSKTKPGTLLKHHISIRTFSQWDEQRPGFMEMDLVGHEGGESCGDYIQTLDMTDVCTGWTETQAVKNKAQLWVFEAIEQIRERLPFPLLGIDSDNAGEFINSHLYRYCQKEKITFTRARAYRKNDNCYVEQKNYSVVRRAVGYHRYDTEEEQKLLNELYCHLRFYTNYFQPVMKLLEKARIGSKVTKKYDKPKTPYQRVLESPDVDKEKKKELRHEYAKLNPAELKRQITRIQNKLKNLAVRRGQMKRKELNQDKNNGKNHKDLEYIFREATNHAFK